MVLSRCVGASARALERAGRVAGGGHAVLAGDAGADALLHVLGIVRAVELPGAVTDRAGHVIVGRAGGQRRRRQDDNENGAHRQRSVEGALAGNRAAATAPGPRKSNSPLRMTRGG